MTDEQREQQARETNESRFAFPESDEGIGYYWDGELVSPDEFSRLVSEKANRLRAERDSEGK